MSLPPNYIPSLWTFTLPLCVDRDLESGFITNARISEPAILFPFDLDNPASPETQHTRVTVETSTFEGYDAYYVGLAEELEGTCLTLDRKVVKALRRPKLAFCISEDLPKNWAD